MEIRPVQRNEALAVARAHIQADEETYRPIFGAKFRAVALEESLARWEAALTGGDVLLVAADGEVIVGLAHVHGGWMSALYLLADYRRGGLGKRLLRALLDASTALGVTEVEFQCVAANAGAIAFYEAMGARRIGRKIEGEGDDAWEDIVFALSTDAPAASRRG